VKTDKLEQVGATILIYGDSGTGKTTSAGTLPEGSTLFLDVEGGVASLRGRKHDAVRVKDDLSNLRELFQWVRLGGDVGKKYKNVVLDSATELEQHMLIALGSGGKRQGAPELQHYQIAQYRMREYLRILRDLRDRGVNVVVTALEMQLQMEQGQAVQRSRSYPMLAKKIAPEVCGLFDVVGHQVISNKDGHEGERFIVLEATDRAVGKNRWTDDTFIEAGNLGEFIARIRKGE
jgi:phage nucleotide-binding protein